MRETETETDTETETERQTDRVAFETALCNGYQLWPNPRFAHLLCDDFLHLSDKQIEAWVKVHDEARLEGAVLQCCQFLKQTIGWKPP